MQIACVTRQTKDVCVCAWRTKSVHIEQKLTKLFAIVLSIYIISDSKFDPHTGVEFSEYFVNQSIYKLSILAI